IPDVLRCLLTASSNIKLYPPESTAIRYSIEQLYQALKGFLSKRPALTLARIGESMLVNGKKIDTGDFKTMADSFLRFIESVNLKSLSFLRDISVRELVAFISAAGQSPANSYDIFFWRRLAREQQLFTILFDQRLYGIAGERVGIGADHLEKAEEDSHEDDLPPEQVTPGGHPEVAQSLSGVPQAIEPSQDSADLEPSEMQLSDRSIDAVADKLSDILLKGDQHQILHIMNRLFHNFAGQGNFTRTKVVNLCENVLEDPVYGSQPTVVEFFIDPLLRVFPQEGELGILRQIAALLSRTAANLIQFGDYQMASRILTHLRDRQNQLQANTKEFSDETIFLRELDPKTQMILLEDLRSKDPARLQRVTQLLSSLGPVAIPLLVEVVKGEDSLRLRQIASYLLKSLGPEAARLLKRELVLEGFPKERTRILEVIDGVTQDLKTELAYALSDDNPKVRRAAFHLTERLHDAQITSLLFDYANHEDPKMAVIAIKTIGKVKPVGALDVLLSLLESSKEVERLLACCRALGQIADPAAIEPLAKMLSPGSILSFRKRRSSAIRAAAAFALAQISHPRVAEVLAPYTDDHDPRIRQIAKSRIAE
ncbi:MAG TPA: HEAT repeat domain-containing protein, partial [Desulfobacterales bacterium]|nr:HEAT repeat domain-containing protein [Desulfobacterales bacterium]